MCAKGGFYMQTIWKPNDFQNSLRKKNDRSANKRFDARIDIARQTTQTVIHMTNSITKALTKDIVNVAYAQERRKHER